MPRKRPVPGVGWNPHTQTPIIPQTVKSRERVCGEWKVIAVTVVDAQVVALDPRTGEAWDATNFARELRQLGISGTNVAVTTNTPGELYEYLREAGPAAGAGFKASGFVREAPSYLITGQMGRVEEVKAAFTSYKWQRDKAGIILDPVAFCGEAAPDVIGAHPDDDAEATLYRLALWARSVIQWCRSSGFDLRPGRGGIAAQALTDARWFPDRRRKVPRFLNEIARHELPGNMYRAYTHRKVRDAVEYDQRGAHHQAAERIAFTDPNSIMGTGWITDPHGTRVYCRPDDPAWDELTKMPGLFWIRVRIHSDATNDIPPRLPVLQNAGEYTAPIWSTELPELYRDDVTILHMVAAIVSETRTEQGGLNAFAAWAQEQLSSASKSDARWLKPMLLSVYGALAQTARPIGRFSNEPTPASEPGVIIIGGQPIKANISRSKRAAEPRYVNVTDRGLIESETRMESIRLARAMWDGWDGERRELIAIYADAILVSAEGSMGGVFASDGIEHLEWAKSHGIKAEWRARERTNLQMLNPNSYSSDQVVKTPGIPKVRRK